MQWLKIFDQRYLLIPLGTRKVAYSKANEMMVYLEIFIFGFRVARFHVNEVN